VADALNKGDEVLIVEGTAYYDAELSSMAVVATSAITRSKKQKRNPAPRPANAASTGQPKAAAAPSEAAAKTVYEGTPPPEMRPEIGRVCGGLSKTPVTN